MCFIPARGGSKGIKNKNLKKILNKTLLEISIDQAKKSKIFDLILVSSDSSKILNIAKKSHVSFYKRSKKNSSDISSTDDALYETLKNFKSNSDYIVILQVTSPLRKISTIKKFVKHCIKNNLDTCCTVTKISEQIAQEKKFLNPIYETKLRRRQLRKNFIFENGLLYFIKRDFFLKNKKIYPKKDWNYFVTNRYEALDINSIEDLRVAKLIMGSY
tara:strand:+ start:44 stop:691 length:648 start_codon:yes stop_codon:yes gene_type:complete